MTMLRVCAQLQECDLVERLQLVSEGFNFLLPLGSFLSVDNINVFHLMVKFSNIFDVFLI